MGNAAQDALMGLLHDAVLVPVVIVVQALSTFVSFQFHGLYGLFTHSFGTVVVVLSGFIGISVAAKLLGDADRRVHEWDAEWFLLCVFLFAGALASSWASYMASFGPGSVFDQLRLIGAACLSMAAVGFGAKFCGKNR